ncbi:MAG: ArsB/NhaD family transporter [Jatrophihabitans sp.]
MPAVIAAVIFVSGYAAIASERFDRVKIVLGGAGLLLALQIIDLEDAAHSTEYGVDWNVIFLLLGMMVIVAGVQRTGLFDYLALHAVRRAGGRPFRLMILLVVLTAVASALVDNVTTVLLVAPMVLSLTRELGLNPVPYLLSIVFASNIGGTATLIGDPPNIIIGSTANLTYVDFLVHLTPLVILLIVVFVGLCRVMFRGSFQVDPGRAAAVQAIDPRERITDHRMLAWSLAVLAAVTVLFALHGVVDYEPGVVAILGAGVMMIVAASPGDLLDEVEWPTLAFFIGLFIMVGALVKVGIVESIAERFADLIDGRLLMGCLLLLVVSAVLSAIVDNIPYVATMTPIVATIVAGLPAGTDGDPLWWSLALGADLGGNATPVGASANLIVLAIAARNGYTISFGRFVKYGLVVSVVTIGVSALYVYLRYFVIAG